MVHNFIALPFCILLLSIALGPLFFGEQWEKHYPKVIVLLSSIVVLYYIFHFRTCVPITLAVVEYIQFISLIFALYTVSSGIYININLEPTPRVNTLFLIFGAITANFIGTTGASMLLIRPYMKMNGARLKPYHIVFFIFIISNIGGALTPIGDPPLFIGFLKGVPFFWTLVHNIFPWLLAITLLCTVFFFFDCRNKIKVSNLKNDNTPIIEIEGKRNIFFILSIICSVFINPTVITSLPTISYHGHEFSIIREVLLLFIAIVSFLTIEKEILKKNHFNWEPIKELAILFAGIFITMTPVLSILTNLIKNIDHDSITTSALFWSTGMLSSTLDNAPTYLNFLTISMSAQNLDVSNLQHVVDYANGLYPNSINNLRAISVSAVFFGAITYIGNGPNLMVKSIAEKQKIKMPTFFEYMTNYSLKILLPILFICWLICCL